MFRKLCLSAAAVTAMTLGFGATAAAGDRCAPCVYETVITYKTVITYHHERVPYTKFVTKYDHCGRPYRVEEVCYKTIKVAKETLVPVKKLVKVSH